VHKHIKFCKRKTGKNAETISPFDILSSAWSYKAISKENNAQRKMMTVPMTWVNISFQDQCLFTQRRAKNCIIGSIFRRGNLAKGENKQ